MRANSDYWPPKFGYSSAAASGSSTGLHWSCVLQMVQQYQQFATLNTIAQLLALVSRVIVKRVRVTHQQTLFTSERAYRLGSCIC